MAHCTTATSRRRRSRRAGYSIAAILLLIATIAVMLGMARSLFAANSISYTSGINMVIGWLGGMIIGGNLGMSHQRRSNGMAVGIFVGGITGLVSGAVTGGGRIDLPVIVIGSVAMLVLAGVVRAASRPKDTLDGDSNNDARSKLSQLLSDMSPRQMLALMLVLLTSAYAVIKFIDLVQDREYLSVPVIVGRVTLIVALLGLTGFLTRLVLRRPAAPGNPVGLSAIDILDEPPGSA